MTLPALTPVVLRLEEEISSKKSKTGDRFRISVAEVVKIGDVAVIPAGTAGEGEVIHVSKPGAAGKAGELILAARFVRVGESEIRLRSFSMGVAGKDETTGALAASFVVGPLAFASRGGDAVAPLGALGTAKTAVELHFPVTVASDVPSLPEDMPSQEDREK